ncbi:TIGR04282 family arsenosugar biosynthesis glycosyltransferase [Allomuricauda sp. SCSIO 65647]|uniref:TIGR04282 family arsenosugar biosynthesis glycosyltransferase n=1 Tax=Allomuricauda sp. SCSIO 65647 TaxID=2908843 RepID=UPI001EFF6F31|nr:TIGR04282 family arsenosugar biosynthesis glycosyltransferase [Muricauda sp. SCSIO 65647]UJH66286.1 TIGR04282 family arsenosugar biosynthesis glycosyltransferase [Muricauda sp. SCSIO 65647]
MSNPKSLLLIFTRNPEPGKCKTRLAKTIGDEAALEVYLFLLRHTQKITQYLTVEKRVYYSEEIWDDDIWKDGNYTKKLQLGNDLGERMQDAFQAGFNDRFEKIIIIGSDMYELSEADLNKAFDALDDSDYVVGPAHDGGYYLLGMKKMNAKLFKNKKWGTESVLQATLTDLKNDQITLLEERNDVDLYKDIKGIEAFKPFLKHMEE